MAQQNNIVRGDDLMLFDASGHSFAYATSHTLAVSADAQEISSKDSGKWKANKVTKLSWEISSENLYTEEDYTALMDKMLSRELIPISFGVKDADELDVDGIDVHTNAYWSKGTVGYKGSAYITSINANANTGENATYSVTLTGASSLTKFTA